MLVRLPTLHSTLITGTLLLMSWAPADAQIAVLRDSQTNAIVAVSGLSENQPCTAEHGTGEIERVTFGKDGVEGFAYKDKKMGSTYVNASFYHGQPRERAEIRTWLKDILHPKTVVSLELNFCGAGGRVVELQTIEIVKQASSEAASQPPAMSAGSLRLSPLPSAASSPADPNDGQWRYGRHPVLGLTAHVTSRGEAIGFACAFRGVDLMRADTVRIRMTPSVAASATSQYGVLMFYDRGTGGGNYAFKPQGAFVQMEEDACGLLQTAQKSGRLLVVEGKQIGLTFSDAESFADIEQRGIKKRISSERDFTHLSDVFEFSLKGANLAIRQLINACPAIRADIRNECGRGH